MDPKNKSRIYEIKRFSIIIVDMCVCACVCVQGNDRRVKTTTKLVYFEPVDGSKYLL